MSKPNYQHNQNLNFVRLAANLYIEEFLNNICTNEYYGYTTHFFFILTQLFKKCKGNKSDREKERVKKELGFEQKQTVALSSMICVLNSPCT